MVEFRVERAFVEACGLPPEMPLGPLRSRLGDILDQARALHPEASVDVEAFAVVLGECAAGAPDLSAAFAALAPLHVADLWIAFCCGRGSSSAIAALEREHLGPARAALARMLGPSEAVDGIQILREKLLVGRDGAPPK